MKKELILLYIFNDPDKMATYMQESEIKLGDTCKKS